MRRQIRKNFDEYTIAGFAQSIREGGLLQPVRVRKVNGRYKIIVGERRYRACRLAGLTKVPVIIEQRELSQAAILYGQLGETCLRVDLSPLETAQAIDDLMQVGRACHETRPFLDCMTKQASGLHGHVQACAEHGLLQRF
jgi:ParB family chromosome partitioning protein